MILWLVLLLDGEGEDLQLWLCFQSQLWSFFNFQFDFFFDLWKTFFAKSDFGQSEDRRDEISFAATSADVLLAVLTLVFFTEEIKRFGTNVTLGS